MELFLLSNILITLVTILYNRYSHASISAKLTLSTFSLLCWVIPFTLLRDYLPQEVAVSVQWVLPLTSQISSTTDITTDPTLLEQITLVKMTGLAGFIGLLLFGARLYQHRKWLIKLKNDPETKLLCRHQGYPVYSSSRIENAILTGYKTPSIWINPELVDSPYFDIILQHETTHIKHKDNYWLFLTELIQSVYWWNPLVKILTKQFKEQLESRCDYKSSQLFTEGIYQQKLTDLILKSMPVSNTGFASAAISRNSNIRRLKSLKEKQTMNLFSKLSIGALLISGITILTMPLSLANTQTSTEESLSHEFKAQTLLKIDYKKDNGKKVENELIVTNKQWTGFQSGDYRFNIFTQLIDNDKVSLEIKIYEKNNGSYKMTATPSMITKIGNPAGIMIGEEGPSNVFKGFSLNVTPEKI